MSLRSTPILLAITTTPACLPPTAEVAGIDDTDDAGASASGSADGSGQTTGPGATGANTADTADSTDGADSTDTGDLPPEDCAAPDPATTASFTLDISDWPQHDAFEVDLEVDCFLQPSAQTEDTITYALTCDDDGVERIASLTVSVPYPLVPENPGGGGYEPLLVCEAEGMLAGAGPATLRYVAVTDAGGLIGGDDGGDPLPSHFLLESFSLHGELGLLAAGFDDWELRPALYAPLTLDEDDVPCDPSPNDDALDGDDHPLVLTVTSDEAVVDIVGGHQAWLPGGMGGYTIAAERAEAIETIGHTAREYGLLVLGWCATAE